MPAPAIDDFALPASLATLQPLSSAPPTDDAYAPRAASDTKLFDDMLCRQSELMRQLDDILDELRCPIGREEPLMTDAMLVLPSGQTYAQRSLQEYMKKHNVVTLVGLECPITRVPIQHVVPNMRVRAIAELVRAGSRVL